MVIDLDHLAGEMDAIEQRGIRVGPENLKLSDKATISMPWHKVQDGMEDDRLARKGTAFGSTRRGIAYAYSDKYRKKTLRLGGSAASGRKAGAGIPNCKLDHVVGVLKAYSTCVGAGPFAAENAMSESWNEQLRKAGGEYGAATGRPRRVGPFDCVASRYGLACQGADKIALTKLDVDNDLRAAYFDQVHNGVYIRMAIILALLGIPDPLTGKKVLQR